jgi:hypothetical protein
MLKLKTNPPRGSGETIEATHLKIALCLFLGSKVTEKARCEPLVSIKI